MRKKWVIITGLVLLILVGLVVLFLSRSHLRTLATLHKVDDYPLYVMTYYGDYGFKDFLQVGIRLGGHSQSCDWQLSPSWACTCFTALNGEDDLLLGRNFDWRNRPTLMLFTASPDGYASVSMVDISYFGFGTEEPSWLDRTKLLGAPYWPFDGMNEAGLAIGMMAVPHAEASDDPDKVTIDSLQAIRLLLDYAGDVDEAISLLQNYNIDFGDGPLLHYLIADSSGDSAVVEFLDGEMNVIQSSLPWQVSTNFVISEEHPEGADSSCWRYNHAYETLERADGNLSQEEAMAILESTSQSGDYHTMWSVVYDMTTGDIRAAMGRRYDEVREFKLKMMAAP
jgi:hypothetical protein